MQPYVMKKFFIDLSKLTLAAILVLLLLFFSIIYFEDSVFDIPRHTDEETVRAWLHDLKPEEDKNFKAKTLKEMCESKNAVDSGWCTGYMLGFVEGHGTAKDRLFCVNSEFSKDQVLQSFGNFMDDNPQHWGKSRSVIMAASLQKAFDCTPINTY
tara:strand:+ start:217 stop:681 length:465 start_codon:yes stop_codon:yes gene_type:complete